MSHDRAKIWKKKYEGFSLQKLTALVSSDINGLGRAEKRFVTELAQKLYMKANPPKKATSI